MRSGALLRAFCSRVLRTSTCWQTQRSGAACFQASCCFGRCAGCRNGVRSPRYRLGKGLLGPRVVNLQVSHLLGFPEGPSNTASPSLMHSRKSGCIPSRVPLVHLGLGFLSLPFLALFITHLHLWLPPFSLKAHEEEVRKKFRPIEQLKEEFEKLNMKMETDYEIMVKLITKFNSSASTLDEKVAALYDLEYYVHQVTKRHQ